MSKAPKRSDIAYISSRFLLALLLLAAPILLVQPMDLSDGLVVIILAVIFYVVVACLVNPQIEPEEVKARLHPLDSPDMFTRASLAFRFFMWPGAFIGISIRDFYRLFLPIKKASRRSRKSKRRRR